MKYSVDKIEDNLVLLENIMTGEKKELLKSDLPFEIKEGSIIIESNEQYKIDYDEEKQRRSAIINKFNRLKKK